ncbi:MAG: hypothetical protein JXX14_17435 [Deltaproteobacteria bacterium]|nr:hypothetical protein [Deltaproteobacteria bacterium]
MNRELHIIVAIHVTDRIQHAGQLQQVLSEYGCYIKTRIGLHEANENYCSTNGVIILELLGIEEKANSLVADVQKIVGLEVQKIVFDHASDNMPSPK